MKHVLIIGKKFSGFVNFLEENGYEYTELRDIKSTKYPEKKLKHRVVADFSSREKVLAAVDALPVKPDAVFAIYENYILPAAWVAEYLELPGLPVAAAEACTDKYLMRSLFREAPAKISPDFREAHTWEEVQAFAEEHEFPLIMKPANLSKSLLVTKSCNLDELRANYDRTMAKIGEIYQKYAPDRAPKLLIEEYLDGSVHSVDAFVDADGTPHVMREIVDYQTGYEVGYDDNFHYSRILPTRLSAEEQRAFLECAEMGCQALGMRSSAAHIEIIMTKNGPRIVEIGARNGGYRERMYRLANGIDVTRNALRLAFGEKPEIKATKNEPVAVLELFPHEAGEFVELSAQAELEKLASLEYLAIKAEPGKFIGKSSDGFKAAAIIILHHADAEVFAKDLDFVNNNVHIVTK